MSDGFIRDPKKYADRTVQRWHAESYGDTTTTAIDVDLLGYCRSCSAPLYIIEASESRTKPTTVIQRLAERCMVPAILIVHRQGRITEAKRVGGIDPTTSWPKDRWMTFAEIAPYLDAIRADHKAVVRHGGDQ
jgi:hypothetical protein